MKKILLLRAFYGVNIHSDAHGDLGIHEYTANCFPDLPFLTAATIASRTDEFDLHVIDAIADRLLPDEMLRSLKESYDCIFLKATAPAIRQDLELMRQLKEKYPESKTFIAGHIAKLIKNWILENRKDIDGVIEEPIDVFMYKFAHGIEDSAQINIDDFPTPDYNLINYKNFKDDNGKPRLCLQTSRGCPMKCSYCPYSAFYGDKISFRSIDNIILDIKELLKLNPSVLQFRDQYFTANRKFTEELCRRIIKEGLKFKWVCETRLDNFDNSLVDLMAQAGLDMICFGVESGSASVLENYNRDSMNMHKLKKIIDHINNKGIKTLAFYIVGFPEDTWETVNDTYDLAVKLNTSYVKFSAFEPCVIDMSEKNFTPYIFNPFENSMNITVNSNLSKDEIKYLVQLFTIMFCFKNESLKKSYKKIYEYNSKYETMLEKLKTLSTDFNKISMYIRENLALSGTAN